MRRIGVFVFYTPDGQVDDYIDVLLNSMQTIIQKLIVVINGEICEAGFNKIEKYSDNIFVRENQGYDVGAYKDVFTEPWLEDEWGNWDQIILFNDTFYGPIFPWENIFNRMEDEATDFWGLSRYPEGGCKMSTGEEMPSHIQGYFLVCRKKMFLSLFWKEFWNRLEYPKSYIEAVERFEINFTKYFTEKGYSNSAYTDKIPINIENGKNPYIYYFQDLICEFGFPVLKKKTICLMNLEELNTVIDYINEKTNYDTYLISSNIHRLYMNALFNPIAPFDSDKLKEFYDVHKRIFIYGRGAYGKGISRYFKYMGWEFEGYIVSQMDQEEAEMNIFAYKDMMFQPEDGIILALGKESFYEVYPIVKKELSGSQLLYPIY